MPNETPLPPEVEQETEETQSEEVSEELPLPDEKTLLMQRAKMMGLKVSNNIGLETLRAKIKEHTEAQEKQAEESEEQEQEQPRFTPVAQAAAPAPSVPPQMAEQALPKKPPTKQQRRQKLIKDATRLVRLRITNMDPKKRDLPGEIFSISNKFIGTIKKFIPFGEATEAGFHVPYCLYELLRDKKFLHIRTVGKDRNSRVVTSYEREFALEVLPQLTHEEIKKLALEQAARNTGSQK